MQHIAEFPTARAAQLLGTLSKHFAHKIKVDIHESHSKFHFDIGEGKIETTPDGLLLTAEASGDDNMQNLRDVLERHLLRFAHREDPQPLNWKTP